MIIKKSASAGTLESSDVYVLIEPSDAGIELELESSVINQYGEKIKTTVLKALSKLDVSNAKVKIVDKGALDCTIKARVQCAVFRANENEETISWGDLII